MLPFKFSIPNEIWLPDFGKRTKKVIKASLVKLCAEFATRYKIPNLAPKFGAYAVYVRAADVGNARGRAIKGQIVLSNTKRSVPTFTEDSIAQIVVHEWLHLVLGSTHTANPKDIFHSNAARNLTSSLSFFRKHFA